jgi:hypothetical protein
VSFVTDLSSSGLISTLTLNEEIERRGLRSRDCLTVWTLLRLRQRSTLPRIFFASSWDRFSARPRCRGTE